MTQSQPPTSTGKANEDQVTLLVFKDNFVSRTFQVPLNWFYRFGLILCALVGTTFIAAAIAFQYYRVAHRADPSRVKDLEQQLSDLKTSYQALEAKAANQAANPQVVGQSQAPQVQDEGSPIPMLPPPGSETAAPSNPDSMLLTDDPLLFHALPEHIQEPPKDQASIPITINNLRAHWEGKLLKVRFAIQYTSPNKGSQQGRIIILARGPDAMVGYPSGVFNPVGRDSLIDPNQGEYFSVSRFREVNAEFGPVQSTDDLHDVEIIILGQPGQLLIHRKLVPEKAKSQKKAADE